VAGIDVGFEHGGTLARAAIAVLRLRDLTPVDQAIARRSADFPYVPGLLSFREIPVVLDALAGLRASPQLLVCDGQGLAHPRRFGLACHLGWIVDTPCIGVAKSRLIGSFHDPEQRRGAATPLRHDEEVIGAALRSRGRGETGVRLDRPPGRAGQRDRAGHGVHRRLPSARDYPACPPAGVETP
jgi:deoxyribonuclease V